MDQITIGKFIARKRKELNLTQEQLAEKLGVSNKTISKWETGKSMPDYGIISSLCETLGITLPELMDGEAAAEQSIRTYDDAQILDLIKRVQDMEAQKNSLHGTVVAAMGMALTAMSFGIEGSNLRDFLSGFCIGLGAVMMIIGIYLTVKYMPRK
ncbi:MAG: helix-turn-helix domain-containing protein [Clostridia bacterium]|nr:helix-turn-helix domain-containing protein [Clostridia bacterium]